MTILNSADLRNNLADVLEMVAVNRKPVVIGRFGQPKAVLVDFFTYNWQKQVIALLKKINRLTSSEIETLNLLLDERARNALFVGLREKEKGEVVSLEEFLKAK